MYAYRSESLAEDVLRINHNNTKDPRFFSMSFREKFYKILKTYDGGDYIHFTKDEKIINADNNYQFDDHECDHMVIALVTDLLIKQGSILLKEVYAKKNAVVGSQSVLRAIACDQNLTILSETRIIRWADAIGICRIGNQCDLGLSSSSGKQLIIGKQCTFQRLFSPEIVLGVDSNSYLETTGKTETVEIAIINNEIFRDIDVIDDTNTNEEKVFDGTIITKHNLRVFNGFIVQGDIRSHQSVVVEDNCIIHGNIYAEEDIYIGYNSRIYGILFTQENIIVNDGAEIGIAGKIKSVVARGDITFGKNCKVFGYIGTERLGLIDPEI
jgi:predicted acyltransferase (DUF342 family)